MGQIIMLFVLALPVACVAWTVTHEEVFQELRQYFIARKRSARNILLRKFFYVFTCEYCFSHYVAAFFLAVTGFTLLVPGWAGTVTAFFALVWVANHYMSLYLALRLSIQRKRLQAAPAAQAAGPATERRLRPVDPRGARPAMADDPIRPGLHDRALPRG